MAKYSVVIMFLLWEAPLGKLRGGQFEQSLTSRCPDTWIAPHRSVLVEGMPKPLWWPSLFQPCTFFQNGIAVHVNNTRCELLLAFLDALECWSADPFSSRLLLSPLYLRDGRSISSLQERLCGLLHICVLGWESLGNTPKPLQFPEVWNRSDKTDNLLSKANKFRNILGHNADQFADLCVDWIHKCHYRGKECLMDWRSLHWRFSQAFKTMSGFVSHSLSIYVPGTTLLTKPCWLLKQLKSSLPTPQFLACKDRFVPVRRK